jgi:hypothetical protein
MLAAIPSGLCQSSSDASDNNHKTKQEKSHPSVKRQQDDQTPPKKEKRGSLVIAPISISSPAFGSGLILMAGYVFKFDKEDAVSSPLWLGAAGAFTSNGTRA